MRRTFVFALPLLGALLLPPSASGQVNLTVRFGARLGPEVAVYAYSPERLGDWRSNFRQWTPITLYDINGRYYRTRITGARPVLVYRYRDEYFLPPQDQAWSGLDRRYNYRRRPSSDDFTRGRPWAERARVDPRLGPEIGVLGYSEDRAGPWRRNYRRWTPVTVYEVGGRYYPNRVEDARPVSVYRYRDEYFLPPQDDQWSGKDRRFNNRPAPTDADRTRVRPRP